MDALLHGNCVCAVSPTFLPLKSGGCGLTPLGLGEVKTQAAPALVSFQVHVTRPGAPPVVLGASVVDDVLVSVVELLVSVVVLLVEPVVLLVDPVVVLVSVVELLVEVEPVVELLVEVLSVVELLVEVLSVVELLVEVLSVVELLVEVEVLVLVVVVGSRNSCLPELWTRVALFA